MVAMKKNALLKMRIVIYSVALRSIAQDGRHSALNDDSKEIRMVPKILRTFFLGKKVHTGVKFKRLPQIITG